MRWPYDKRVEATHAWGVIAVGTAAIIGIPTVLATLHASDRHFSWWWPTNWMYVPFTILMIGLLLLVIPIRRSKASESRDIGSPSERATIGVRQTAIRVAGAMTGGRNAPADANISVKQHIGEVSPGGTVIGYEQDEND
jgi:hypothetical protein